MKQYLLSMGLVCLIAVGEMAAQTEPYINGRLDVDNRGISFMNKDSTMLVIMRFRMQALAQTETVSDEDLSTSRENWVLRRLRLRFGGFLTDPRLTYNIQLSFTRGDMDFADTGFPNIVRDAVVYWNFDNNWQIGFGQTKLPGNRQRVVSSSEMQYAERSVVNNTFNIDRDFGFQGWYRNTIEGVGLNLRAAISNGDGRNTISTSGASAGGFCYTGRAEILHLELLPVVVIILKAMFCARKHPNYLSEQLIPSIAACAAQWGNSVLNYIHQPQTAIISLFLRIHCLPMLY
ncbi:MAG: hypothetical protein IPK11_12690 [Ignavibacteria bacterium]|nr:hypothetical protein [Ignavibacteria bacterium]